jgi:hypothetical protein
MRRLAALVAIVLLVVAASSGTTLTAFRRQRRARDSERALGRNVLAEIPADDDPRLFSEDEVRFHYGEASVDKDLIVAVRVLINGSPIAAHVSIRHPVDIKASGDERGSPGRDRADRWTWRSKQSTGDAGRMRRDQRARLARTRENRV